MSGSIQTGALFLRCEALIHDQNDMRTDTCMHHSNITPHTCSRCELGGILLRRRMLERKCACIKTCIEFLITALACMQVYLQMSQVGHAQDWHQCFSGMMFKVLQDSYVHSGLAKHSATRVEHLVSLSPSRVGWDPVGHPGHYVWM